MADRKQAALKAEAALAEFLSVANSSLWESDVKKIKAALSVVRSHT